MNTNININIEDIYYKKYIKYKTKYLELKEQSGGNCKEHEKYKRDIKISYENLFYSLKNTMNTEIRKQIKILYENYTDSINHHIKEEIIKTQIENIEKIYKIKQVSPYIKIQINNFIKEINKGFTCTNTNTVPVTPPTKTVSVTPTSQKVHVTPHTQTVHLDPKTQEIMKQWTAPIPPPRAAPIPAPRAAPIPPPRAAPIPAPRVGSATALQKVQAPPRPSKK